MSELSKLFKLFSEFSKIYCGLKKHVALYFYIITFFKLQKNIIIAKLQKMTK